MGKRYKGQIRSPEWWDGFRAGREDFLEASRIIRKSLNDLKIASLAARIENLESSLERQTSGLFMPPPGATPEQVAQFKQLAGGA